MTLLDAPPPKPPIHIWRYIVLGILILLIAEGLYYSFRNYPEERAVTRFLTTLEQGNFQEAYRLWQPSPSYSYQDFLHGWGTQGDYGKIRGFETAIHIDIGHCHSLAIRECERPEVARTEGCDDGVTRHDLGLFRRFGLVVGIGD